MKRKTGFLCAAALCASFLFLSAALTATEVPDSIVLREGGQKSYIMGPVPFSHQAHGEDYGVDCTQCHHVYINGINVWKQGDPQWKCEACHDPYRNKGNVKKLRLAYHMLCVGCHREMAKEDITQDAPYRMCDECHEKKP